ncbi:MAG: ABC transporter ATP-binding protein [bacterium]|nr:ABC transporter ATP-binding protein [bacterium]
MIEIYGLYYGQIFENLNIVFKNKKNLIYGVNGIGKTTLLKLIIGSLKPSKGVVKVSGAVSLLPQEFNCPFSYKVYELIKLKMDYIEDALVKYWCGKAGIYTDRFFNNLSGGEKRRVLLIKLLLKKADIYLLDEPQEFLDEDGLKFLNEVIEFIVSKNGLIIITTAIKNFFTGFDLFEIKNKTIVPVEEKEVV